MQPTPQNFQLVQQTQPTIPYSCPCLHCLNQNRVNNANLTSSTTSLSNNSVPLIEMIPSPPIIDPSQVQQRIFFQEDNISWEL